jgi:hypothetical protein
MSGCVNWLIRFGSACCLYFYTFTLKMEVPNCLETSVPINKTTQGQAALPRDCVLVLCLLCQLFPPPPPPPSVHIVSGAHASASLMGNTSSFSAGKAGRGVKPTTQHLVQIIRMCVYCLSRHRDMMLN